MNSLILLLITVLTPPVSYRQLQWSDFKGKPPAGTEAHACTCSNIVIGMDTAYAIFLPDKSWTRTNDSALLRHEQVHFDITRRFAKKVDEYLKCKSYTCKEPVGFILDRWRLQQAQYDIETDHGQNATEQKRWEEMIKL